MRRPLVAGNWKMHKTPSQAVAFTKHLLELLPSFPDSVEVALAPPFPALPGVSQLITATPIKLAAQNSHWEKEGAFTGEVSPPMLTDLGCSYVILGHSERRRLFAETDLLVNRKLHAAFTHGLIPIVCIGETLEEREAGQTFHVLETQLLAGLDGLSSNQIASLTIAYEPVWAIGTGRAATVHQAAEAHAHIRTTIAATWSLDPSAIRILYGGSVTPENAAELFASPQINGALVGKACLEPRSFASIIHAFPSTQNSSSVAACTH